MDYNDLAGLLVAILGSVTPINAANSELPSSLLGEENFETDTWGHCQVPEELHPELGIGRDQQPTASQLAAYRLTHRQLYQPTPAPPLPVRMPGEFEPATTLLLAYRHYEDYEDIFADIMYWAHEHGEVRILVEREGRRRIASLLHKVDMSLDQVTIDEQTPYDTVWIRDWGPQPVIMAEEVVSVDSRYFINCLLDDAAPTTLAYQTESHQVYRTDLWLEGGNLLSNGAGLCLTTTGILRHNNSSEHYVSQVLRDFYGCQQTVYLQPLVGNVVDHVDMFLTLADENVVLLGQYEVAQDPVNARILEENARQLRRVITPSGRPLSIIRVPMPNPGLQSDDSLQSGLIRSYLNLVIFNGLVLVPVYDEDQHYEERALAILEDTFSGRIVVPIAADRLALDNGTLHCISRTVPVIEERARDRPL